MKYNLNINKNIFKTITTLFAPFFISFISMKDLENDANKPTLNKCEFFCLNWQPWFEHCERNCSQKFGKQIRKRDCFNCSVDECLKVNNEQFVSHDYPLNETQFCYQGQLLKKYISLKIFT
jgi:hypothetical protein